MFIEDPAEFQPPSTKTTIWLISFTDLMSLMLSFFVLLFSMCHVGGSQWDKLTDAMSQTFNPTHDAGGPATARHSIPTHFGKRAVNLDYLSVIFQDSIGKDASLEGSRVQRLDDRLVISLPGALFFDSDTAVLSERARTAVFDIGGVLRNVRNQVAVHGYTDPQAPSGQYTSNWELSAARAIAVANSLRRSGYDKEIFAFGHVDGDLGRRQDLSLEQRRTLARRVDVVILPDAADK